MKYDYTQPNIKKMYIPVKRNTRPGYNREETKGIVVHHTGLEDVPAINFYHSIMRDSYKAYASYHIVIDFDGTIFIFIPVDERAYASGSYNYSKIGKEIFNSDASAYTVDIECCCASPDYHINNRQQEVVAEVTADLCMHYELHTNKDIYKHFDIAKDKPYCPAYFIRGLNWERLLSMSRTMYERKAIGSLKRLDLY